MRDEIERLRALWSGGILDADANLLQDRLGTERTAALDLFDRARLATVLGVCRDSGSLSAAGRRLFAQSRLQKTAGNDADRLRKYLQRFGLSFETIGGP